MSVVKTTIPRPHRRLGGSPDRRAELTLGALSVSVLALIALMLVTVFAKAWPSFAHNGIKWFFPGGDVDQQLKAIITGPTDPAHYQYHLRAWPLIWDTLVTTALAVILALGVSVLAGVFIVELAPATVRRTIDPVVQLLAAVPSVVYGLIGILVIAPWIERTFISRAAQALGGLRGAADRRQPVDLAVLILALMIVPIMVAIISAALETVPRSWSEGSAALGVNRWRTMWRVSLRTVRPAILAATVLATGARAGRGDHALDGRGLARVPGQPARRGDVPVRARAPAGGDDHRLHRRHLGRAARTDVVCDGGRAARLLRVPLARRRGP